MRLAPLCYVFSPLLRRSSNEQREHQQQQQQEHHTAGNRNRKWKIISILSISMSLGLNTNTYKYNTQTNIIHTQTFSTLKYQQNKINTYKQYSSFALNLRCVCAVEHVVVMWAPPTILYLPSRERNLSQRPPSTPPSTQKLRVRVCVDINSIQECRSSSSSSSWNYWRENRKSITNKCVSFAHQFLLPIILTLFP